jgi:hypothetical protein
VARWRQLVGEVRQVAARLLHGERLQTIGRAVGVGTGDAVGQNHVLEIAIGIVLVGRGLEIDAADRFEGTQFVVGVGGGGSVRRRASRPAS